MSTTTVLFDLDGTLTDPFEGITRSIQYALEKMGAGVPQADALRWCIGPPLWESFEVLLNTSDRVELDRAVAHYRDRYTVTGLFENELVDGIMDVVDALCVGGLKLHVATSKPHAYAGRIVEHFGLEQKFGKVYGSELDGTRSAKAELLAHILAEEGVVPSECVMIGDRKHDLIGARANGVAAIGVLWGYGSRQELEDQGPDYIAEKPADLLHWIKAG